MEMDFMDPYLDLNHCFFTVMWIWDWAKEKPKWPPIKDGRKKIICV
jgi:hypothetical protein